MINYGFNDDEIQDVFMYIGINNNENNEIIKENMKINKDMIIKKQDFKYVIYINWKLFSLNDGKEECPITDEEKNKFYDLLKDNFKHLDYIFAFLNKNRNILKNLDKKRFDIVVKIFEICMDYVSKNINIKSDKSLKELSNRIFVLSNTYYLNDSKELISAQESFRKHELLRNSNYWINEFSSSIEKKKKKKKIIKDKKYISNNFSISLINFKANYKEYVNEDTLKLIITSGKEMLKEKLGDLYNEEEINEAIENANKIQI